MWGIQLVIYYAFNHTSLGEGYVLLEMSSQKRSTHFLRCCSGGVTTPTSSSSGSCCSSAAPSSTTLSSSSRSSTTPPRRTGTEFSPTKIFIIYYFLRHIPRIVGRRKKSEEKERKRKESEAWTPFRPTTQQDPALSALFLPRAAQYCILGGVAHKQATQKQNTNTSRHRVVERRHHQQTTWPHRVHPGRGSCVTSR